MLQAHVLPALAAIVRTIDAVTVRDGALAVVLTGTDPDDVGVFGIDGDCADGVGAFAVEDGSKCCAVILGLPHAATGDADEIAGAIVRVDSDSGHASGDHGRADGAE